MAAAQDAQNITASSLAPDLRGYYVLGRTPVT
eukprot:CAMPEP_0174373616 /NCGR_PEP_ID=MMETSP0811_2-20130205/107903_1 /TAXON_ID=73025 ORGANISM="Eutreptiella gymnastica-like, Strain CCMP1594" /NCGR_SAMPLE_ID=MMETSP0811_2 /ASSEMBLY_ACC=CAM_ASM_000667 /LENGTH=31 /DNA_ID= /DNA_START= /DNA_END= /DNA_ORIENTATION=